MIEIESTSLIPGEIYTLHRVNKDPNKHENAYMLSCRYHHNIEREGESGIISYFDNIITYRGHKLKTTVLLVKTNLALGNVWKFYKSTITEDILQEYNDRRIFAAYMDSVDNRMTHLNRIPGDNYFKYHLAKYIFPSRFVMNNYRNKYRNKNLQKKHADNI